MTVKSMLVSLAWISILLSSQAVAEKAVAHLIIHSHVDAGWVRTFENVYKKTGVNVLDTLTNALYGNEAYRFNWADHIFLERWWQDADDDMKFKFRAILERGQLQIVHPGFVMADEAVVAYYEAMENFELGLHFLYDTFGVVPHVAWGLDTFGFSAYTPALLNKYGIDTVYISRIGNRNRGYMEANGILNYIWEGHPVYGIPSSVFVSQSQFGTYSPSNLAYDVTKKNRGCPIEEWDEKPPRKCMETFYNDALNEFAEQNFYYNDGKDEEYNFPVLFGDDSAFTDSFYNFEYIQKMQVAFDKYSKDIFGVQIELRFSTMDEFFAALSKQDLEYPVYTGDFLPEIEDPARWREPKLQMEYWTGYYSNKPVYKELVRDCFRRIRLSQALTSFVAYQRFLHDAVVLEPDLISRNMDAQLAAVVQLHHDAVTGTHTDNVNYDYVDKIQWANKYSQDQVSQMFQELDDVYKNKNQPLFESLVQFKQKAEKGKVIRIFNPDVRKQENYPFNVTVLSNKYYLCLSEQMEKQPLQALPISFYDNYDKSHGFNKTHSNLFSRVASISPFSSTQMFLFEFGSKLDCLEFYKVYVPGQKASNLKAEDVCTFGVPEVQDYDRGEVPKLEMKKRTDQSKIVLDPQTGLIQQVQYNHIEVELKQEFLAYITWEKSGSGYYLFDPMAPAVPFRDLQVTRIVKYSGPIYSCLHAFMERSLTFQTIHNAYFENIICIEKEHVDRVRQTVNAKSIISHEIMLRTHILKVNERDIDNTIEYWTHDSMYSIKRKVFSHQDALDRRIIKTLKEQGLEEDGSNPDEKLNSYPCNTGLIVKEKITDATFGFAFSHALMCHLMDKNKWQIMLTRATQNPNFQQGIHDQQDDFDYTSLKMDWLLRQIKKEAEFDAFVSDFYELQFDQNYGLLVHVEPLKKSNSYRLVQDVLSKHSQFFADNSNFTFVRSHFDPHVNRIYFYLANKHNQAVDMNDLNTPEDMEATRCNVMDTYFCNDDRFRESQYSMMGARSSGDQLEALEYNKYQVFEQGEEKIMESVDDDEPFVIPPLSEFSFYIQLPAQAPPINHFQDESRHYFKSERRYQAPKNTHVTCLHYTMFFAAGITFYLACIFFIYSLYSNLTRDKIRKTRNRNALQKVSKAA